MTRWLSRLWSICAYSTLAAAIFYAVSDDWSSVLTFSASGVIFIVLSRWPHPF